MVCFCFDTKGHGARGKKRKKIGLVPSTGKSSNSSSSSNVAGGFCWSLRAEPEGASVVVIFVVDVWPSAAPDILGMYSPLGEALCIVKVGPLSWYTAYRSLFFFRGIWSSDKSSRSYRSASGISGEYGGLARLGATSKVP